MYITDQTLYSNNTSTIPRSKQQNHLTKIRDQLSTNNSESLP